MTDVRLADDLQASPPEIALALSRAGVSGVQKAVRIRRGNAATVMAAVIDCTVDLAADQKGVHMSRFPELFEEAIDLVVEQEALLVEVLAEHIASRVVERQGALKPRSGSGPVADPSANAGHGPRDPGDGHPLRDRGGVGGRDAPRRRRRGDRDQRLSLRAGARAQPRRRSDSSRRASRATTSRRSSSSSRSRPTTSAAGRRSSSAPSRTWMRSCSSTSPSAR